MSELENMIQRLCPDGVEYRAVGDVCNICRGVVMSKDFIRDNAGDYPVYSSQTENNGELGKIATYNFDGEYLTWTTDGANAGSVFYRNWKFSVTNVCGVLEIKVKNVLTKFLYYVLQTATKPYVNKGMGNAKLMSNVMARVKIPVPPIEVQREIVRILDNFTNLTADLAVELTVRKKQYEYYRDKLLSFDDVKRMGGYNLEVEYKKIGAFTTVLRGKRLTKDMLIDGGKFPVYHGGLQPLGYYNASNRKSNTVMVINVGASAGSVGYSSVEFWSSDGCYCLEHSSVVLDRYLYYAMQCNEKHIQARVRYAGIPTLDSAIIENIEIPIPSLETQERIINILDKFEMLTNNFVSGIPAEIEARKKQYEYYRDKLLSFKEKVA